MTAKGLDQGRESSMHTTQNVLQTATPSSVYYYQPKWSLRAHDITKDGRGLFYTDKNINSSRKLQNPNYLCIWYKKAPHYRKQKKNLTTMKEKDIPINASVVPTSLSDHGQN